MSEKVNIPKVGVCIVSYNSEKHITGCLSSLYENTNPKFICALVDNASKDQTVNMVYKYFPQTHVVINKINKGYAKANNQAIRYFLKKNVSYVLLLNPDTYVSSSLIQELVSVFEHNPLAGVVGPIVTYENDPKKIWFAGGKFNNIFCISSHPNMNKQLKSVHIYTRSVDFITGACMMIRSSVFGRVGLLPEDYFLYFEDVFFCKKIRHNGLTCMLLAKPLVKHYVSSSTGVMGENIMTPIRAYYFARNPLIYIQKEVRGMQKITCFIGQFFIRLPYYLCRMTWERVFLSIPAYFRGLASGLMLT